MDRVIGETVIRATMVNSEPYLNANDLYKWLTANAEIQVNPQNAATIRAMRDVMEQQVNAS